MNKPLRVTYVLKTVAGYILKMIRGKDEEALVYVFERFSNLGGMYLKFLQLLALEGKVYDIRFANLRDVLAVFDDAQYEKINLEELVPKMHKNLSFVQPQPIAAGSFGQVYSATLHSGKEVIVKVLRPSVQQNLRFDIRMLSIIVKALRFFRAKDMVDIGSVFSELKKLTLNETDYLKEAAYAEAMYRQYKDHPVIVIPKTYLDLSTKNILVQDRIDGLPLTKLIGTGIKDRHKYVAELINTDLDYVMEQLAFESLNSLLSGSAAHGDPHPGNIFLLPNNRIGLIDFGIQTNQIKRKQEMVQLMQEYVHIYNGNFRPGMFTEKMIGFFAPELIQSLQVVSESSGVNLRQKILESIGVIAQHTVTSGPTKDQADQYMRDFKVQQIFTEVINSKNRFAIKANTEATVMMRSTHIYLSLLDRIGCTKVVVGRAYQRVIDLHKYTGQQSVDYDSESLDHSLHVVSSWLDRLRYSDPVSYIKLQEAIG